MQGFLHGYVASDSGPRCQEGFGLGADMEDAVFLFGWPQNPSRSQVRGAKLQLSTQHVPYVIVLWWPLAQELGFMSRQNV